MSQHETDSKRFNREAVVHYNLRTVEDFYEYMGQANMYKPRFDDLAESAKDTWRKEFAEATAIEP